MGKKAAVARKMDVLSKMLRKVVRSTALDALMARPATIRGRLATSNVANRFEIARTRTCS